MKKRSELQRKLNIERFGKLGAKNPAKILDALDKSLVKWSKLTKDVGTDVDKFAALLKREIYDKLDPNKL